MADSLMDKNWSSLTKLKDHFEKTKTEKVVDFDGMTLTTKKYVYTLISPQLYRTKR